jgi:nitrous oxidase accessory protein NosD
MKQVVFPSIEWSRPLLFFMACFSWLTGGSSFVWAGPVQDMINAATDGGTVTISSGIFDETLTVDKNLTLRGVSPAETILRNNP